MDIPAWVRKLFSDIDRKDTTAFVGHLTDDVEFRFGSAPPVSGAAATGEAVAAFFESIAALSHAIIRVWEDGSSVVCEGIVTYTRHDGRNVAIPFADVFDRRDDKIASYRIYIDINPLFEA